MVDLSIEILNSVIYLLITSKGLVHIYLLKLDKRSGPEKLRSTADHKGARITCLAWNQQGDRLFVGDDLGHVSSANISLGVSIFFFFAVQAVAVQTIVLWLDYKALFIYFRLKSSLGSPVMSS